MKNKFLKTILVLGVLGVWAVPAFGQNYTNLVTSQTVNGTVTGGVASFSVQVPPQYLLLLSGNITNAPTYVTNVVNGVTNVVNNALTNIAVVSQLSVDNANWINWATNNPNNTNGIPTSATLIGSQTIYFRAQVITPNPLTAGVLKQQ